VEAVGRHPKALVSPLSLYLGCRRLTLLVEGFNLTKSPLSLTFGDKRGTHATLVGIGMPTQEAGAKTDHGNEFQGGWPA
jgi:hypothetical protein